MNSYLAKIGVMAAIVISIALLLFTGWPFDERKFKARIDKRARPPSGPVNKIGEDFPATVGANRSRQRRVEGKSQIAARVRSLLNLRAGEIGEIRIPSGELDNWFGPIEHEREPDPFDRSATITTMLTKNHVTSALEGIIENGRGIRIRIGNSTETEFPGENINVKLARIREGSEHSEFVVRISINGRVTLTTTRVMNGASVLVRAVDPNVEGVLILLGDEPKSDTVEVPGDK
jgi:hypothetical protein